MNEGRGLTPAGVAVIVVCGVSLLLVPLLYFVWTNVSFSLGVSAAAVSPPTLAPTITQKFRRVGKDVEMTIVVDNSASSASLDTVNVSALSLGHKAPVSYPRLGRVAAHTTAQARALFKGIPKGTTTIDLNVTYTYSGGSGNGSSGIGGTIEVP